MTILTILKVNVPEFDTLELRKKDLAERLNKKKEGGRSSQLSTKLKRLRKESLKKVQAKERDPIQCD